MKRSGIISVIKKMDTITFDECQIFAQFVEVLSLIMWRKNVLLMII